MLRVTELERRDTPTRPLPSPVIFAGAETGAPPTVKGFDLDTGAVLFDRAVYEAAFTGGVRVATADFTGDAWPDLVVGPGAGGGPRVRVLDGKTGDAVPGPLGDFLAYEPAFAGGVEVAAADVTGDGWPDLLTAAGQGGGPRVRVFDGKTGGQLADFFVFDPAFTGGVSVAAADFTGDGRAELVVGAGPGGGPHVRVIDLATGASIPGPLGSFFAYEPTFTGGVFVGADWKAGNVTGDGRADLIVGPGAGRAPDVGVYSGRTGVKARSLRAFDAGMTAGVRVAAAFVTDDAYADVVVSTGPGVADRVRVFDGHTSVPVGGAMGDFAPFGGTRTGGVAVAASNDPPVAGGGGVSPPPPASPPTSPPSSPPASPPSPPAWPPSQPELVAFSKDPVYAGQLGQTATLYAEVTRPEPGLFHWKYTLDNQSVLAASVPQPLSSGFVNFSVGGDTQGLFNSTTSMTGWSVSQTQAAWSGGWGLPGVMPDEAATFEFDTDERPVIRVGVGEPLTVTTEEDRPGPNLTLGPKAVTVSLAAPDLVPVNANNDNFRPIYSTETLHEVINEADRWKSGDQPYILRVRDFDAAHLWQDDQQLKEVRVSVSGDLPGTLKVSVVNPGGGGGVARLWKDRRKDVAFTSEELPALPQGGNHPDVVLYVEAAHESLILNDIKITATFTCLGADIKAAPRTLSATPVVVLPSIAIPNPSVVFTSFGEGDSQMGIQATNPDGATINDKNVGFRYVAVTADEQSAGFLQNAMYYNNGEVWGGAGYTWIGKTGNGVINPNYARAGCKTGLTVGGRLPKIVPTGGRPCRARPGSGS